MSDVQKQSHSSPNQRALRRLLKNKPAIFGLSIIFLAMLISLLGYLVTPDSTPNANDQVNDLALKPPGYSKTILRVRKNREMPPSSIFHKMFYGRENQYQLIPIEDYQFKNDSLQVSVYRGDQIAPELKMYHLADIVYPISLEKQTIEFVQGLFSFTTVDNQVVAGVSSEELKTKIERKHIRNKFYYFGTDGYGRCLLSRLMIGVRISLSVGLVAVFISLSIGIFMGAMAGYYGGKVDDIIMLLINTVWSIPTLLLVFALVLALGRGFWQIFTAVGLTMWVDVARVVRGQVLGIKSVQYVEAAHSFGFSTFRILFRHIMPNILGPVMVIAAANFAMAILIEAGLSYLGFGIQPPQPSWGTMLAENYSFLLSGGNPFPAIVPGIAIMLMVLSFNLVGNGFRDALDVKTNFQT